MADISSAARRAAVESLRKLARDLGSEALVVPFREMQTPGPHGSPAYTGPDGVWVWRRILEDEPENLHVYLAHEIGHHAVADGEATAEFSHEVVNVAEDLKINQLLLERLGYDVRRVGIRGLLDPRFDGMTVVGACRALAGGASPRARGCGCRSLPHPSILSAARAMRRALGLPERDTIYCDAVDRAEFEAVAGHATMLRTGTFATDVPALVQGVWSHLYQRRPVATKREGLLTNTELLNYALPAERFRDLTRGAATESVVAARNFVRACDADDYVVTAGRDDAQALLTKRLLALREARKLRRRRKVTSREVRLAVLAVARARARLARWTERRPLPELLRDDPVTAATGSSAPMLTLRSASANSRDVLVADLPRLIGSETVRAIRRCASQVAREMREASKLVRKMSEVTGDSLSDQQPEEAGDSPRGRRPSPDARVGSGRGTGENRRARAYRLVEQHGVKLERILFHAQHFLTLLQNPISRRTSDAETTQPSMLAYGSDFENVDSAEVALLARRSTRTEFFLRLSDHSLLQRSPPERKRSPVAICIDGSGSMKGEPYAVAAGFAVAMLKLLARDGRDCALIAFSHVARRVVCRRNYQADFLEALDLLLSPSMGGTNFDAPMRAAQDTRDELHWPSLTTVFVTDGRCALLDRAAYEARRKRQDRAVGVLVGGSAATVDFADEVLTAERSDMAIRLVQMGRRVL